MITTPGVAAAPTSNHDASTTRRHRAGRSWSGSGADAGQALPVPDPWRWVLRYGSYLAVMAIIGIVLADRYIWRGVAAQPILRQIVRWSLLAVAVLALFQLLVVASDIADEAPWSALGSLDAALSTSAGIAPCGAHPAWPGRCGRCCSVLPRSMSRSVAVRSRSAPSRCSAPGRGPGTRPRSAGPSSACPSTSPTTPRPRCGSRASSSSVSSPPGSSVDPGWRPSSSGCRRPPASPSPSSCSPASSSRCGWSEVPVTSSPPTTASTWPSSSS